MRLPMPRISEESLQERLRSLEIECQQLRDSNSRLELENSRLKLQVSSSQATSEQVGSPSRLNGSISVAESHHQVLRTRRRAMLEEQKLLVDELQREIAEVRVPCSKVGACTIAVPCFIAALLLPGNGPTPGSTHQTREPAEARAIDECGSGVETLQKTARASTRK